jgi:hypothetical protein
VHGDGITQDGVPSAPAAVDRNKTMWVLFRPEAAFAEKLAAKELARGMLSLGLTRRAIVAAMTGATPAASDPVFRLLVDKPAFRNPEAYEIARDGTAQNLALTITGATPQAVLYAVFDFLERQGAFFGLDGEVYPPDPVPTMNAPPANQAWRAQPRFGTRGLVPWPNFLTGISTYNGEDFRAYLEAMMRMRLNMLALHVYSYDRHWAEPYLSFDYAGAGYDAFADTSATSRWDYLPERTSRYGMGAKDFFADEVFGSEAATRARSTWDAEGSAQRLWSDALRYAERLGIRTGVGFEPFQVPDEIYSAAPSEAYFASRYPNTPGPRIDPESVAAKDILEARLAQLLDAYPTVDYVWLWEDESMGSIHVTDVPPLLAPVRQAHDFLKRHAPSKRLVVAGWGNLVQHLPYFHERLPEDVIFSSLSNHVGWTPIDEAYGRLGGRERWPIPWLEDDVGMWLPQFHVNRLHDDINRAESLGCQGVLGIHWRTRIVDANAGFQARAAWERSLRPSDYFRNYAAVQTRTQRVQPLADILDQTDRDRLLLGTFNGELAYAADYSSGFLYSEYEVQDSVKRSQLDVARRLRALADTASSPAERERLNYLTRSVELLVPYAESWSVARRLGEVLKEAEELTKHGKAAEAREKVRSEGIPLWLKLAPLVREVFVDYQEIVATRTDLGQLASMHNKYERIALFRLRAAMKEFLGELPVETERLLADVLRSDSNPPRLFVPTRPTLLAAAEHVRVSAVCPGGLTVPQVTLHSRASGSSEWRAKPMQLAGRRTFVSEIGFDGARAPFLDYYVEARFPGTQHPLTAPAEAPARFYTATMM